MNQLENEKKLRAEVDKLNEEIKWKESRIDGVEEKAEERYESLKESLEDSIISWKYISAILGAVALISYTIAARAIGWWSSSGEIVFGIGLLILFIFILCQIEDAVSHNPVTTIFATCFCGLIGFISWLIL